MRCSTLGFTFTVLLLLPGMLALGQISYLLDFKNALPDLYTKYAKAKQDTNAVKLALTIGNFYLTNKGIAQENVDSSYRYQQIAEQLSKNLNYEKGMQDAAVLKIRTLLRRNAFTKAQVLARNSKGVLYCRLHFEIGRYYLEKGGEEKADLATAEKNLAIAENYAKQQHMPVLYNTIRVYRYPLMNEQYIDTAKCEAEFNRIIALCRSNHNKRLEALAWYFKAVNYAPDKISAAYFTRALAAANLAGDIGFAINIRRELADCNLKEGKFDVAEKELLQVISMYQLAGYKNLQFTYDLLTAIKTAQANFEPAMRYGLEAIKYADSTGTDYHLNYMQFRLASICRDMGLKKESIKWTQECLNSTIKLENRFPFLVFRQLTIDLIKDGQAERVLKNLATVIRKYPQEQDRAYFVPMLRGDCYAALKKPVLAEKYYLEAMKLFEKRNIIDTYYFLSCKSIAEFYVDQKLYYEAVPYLQKILNSPKPVFTMTDLAAAHLLQFKVDSASHNYLSAIKHFEYSKAITDSIFNKVRLKQSEQLQLQYDMARRDHENLGLRNRNNMQRSELEKEALNRKLVTLGLLGSVIITALMFYLYRAKQRSNIMLKVRQDEINTQNNSLNQLLTEKEWLMKEIHHRVKNNLQIISSLLNTQSSYLDNEQAIMAIRDSQNRMQAISIVHQKLYQSDDLSTVNLGKYIEELARNIQDSFKGQSNIRFNIKVQDIRLITADTVPLGLILNEAITNSIKYAFDEGAWGNITISMFTISGGLCRLIIHDDGKGLPAGFDIDSITSLGMNLMIGLTDQLHGTFSIHSNTGTTITVTFRPSPAELSS